MKKEAIELTMISIELFVLHLTKKITTRIFLCVYYYLFSHILWATVSISAVFSITENVKLSRQSPLQNMIYFPLIFWHSRWKYFQSWTAPYSKKCPFSSPTTFNTCIFDTYIIPMTYCSAWNKSKNCNMCYWVVYCDLWHCCGVLMVVVGLGN